MSLDDDLAAIDQYMKTTPVQTPAAQKLKDAWIPWSDRNIRGGWWSRDQTIESTYDLARNKRNAFNLANARTAAEREQAKRVAVKGFSTEEAQGQGSRVQSSGTYVVPPPESEPFFPLRVKIAAGIALTAGAILVVVKRIYVDPFLSKR